ncbi:SCO4225 family membrane protein [Streptomyces pilosus]
MTSTAEETTAVTGPVRSLPRRLRHALTDVAALAYLGLCAVLTVWAFTASTGNEDASFAGVIPWLATAPASLVLFVLPDRPAMFLVAIVVGALANALVIGACARVLRRGGGRAAR